MDVQHVLAAAAVTAELRRLFTIASAPEDRSLLRDLSSDDLSRLLALSIEHRVLAVYWERVGAAGLEGTLPEAFPRVSAAIPVMSTSDAISDLTALDVHYEQLLGNLSAESGLPSGSVTLLKGRSLRQWYRPGVKRMSLDVDLCVPDPAHFWQLCQWLIGQGYELLGLGGAHCDPRDDDSWSTIFGFHREGPLTLLPLSVELHGALLTKGLHDFVDMRPIAARADPRSYYRRTGLSDSMLLLLVEVCERPLIVRDAVDFQMLLNALEADGCPDSLREDIEAANLRSQLVRLCRFWSRLSQQPPPRPVREWVERWAARLPWSRLPLFDTRLFGGITPLLEAPRPWSALQAVGTNLSESPAHGARWAKMLRNRPTTITGHPGCRRWFRILHLDGTLGGPPCIALNERGHAMMRSPIGVFLATYAEDFTASEVKRELAAAPSDWRSDAPGALSGDR